MEIRSNKKGREEQKDPKEPASYDLVTMESPDGIGFISEKYRDDQHNPVIATWGESSPTYQNIRESVNHGSKEVDVVPAGMTESAWMLIKPCVDVKISKVGGSDMSLSEAVLPIQVLPDAPQLPTPTDVQLLDYLNPEYYAGFGSSNGVMADVSQMDWSWECSNTRYESTLCPFSVAYYSLAGLEMPH